VLVKKTDNPYADMFVSLQREEAYKNLFGNFRISIPPEYRSESTGILGKEMSANGVTVTTLYEIKDAYTLDKKDLRGQVKTINANEESSKEKLSGNVGYKKGIQVLHFNELQKKRVQFVLNLPPGFYNATTNQLTQSIQIKHFDEQFKLKPLKLTVSKTAEKDGSRIAILEVKNTRRRPSFLKGLWFKVSLGYNTNNSDIRISAAITNESSSTTGVLPTDLYSLYYTQPTATLASAPTPVASPLPSVASTVPQQPPPPLPRLSRPLTPNEINQLLARTKTPLNPTNLATVSKSINLRVKG
jgi:hypothetical protein